VARILLIDDILDSAQPLARLLRLKGHTVLLAPDGLAALESLSQSAPDLILLDLDMPRLDGVGFLRRLRTDPACAAWKRTPVILTTASVAPDALRAATALGISDCLTKSTFSIDDLEECIGAALTQRGEAAPQK
jgi:CheY-like chemotaxis protein